MTCNMIKTVCMVFPPMGIKIVSSDFPKLHIGSSPVEIVHDFKYIGHIVSCTLADDDDDIMREVRNLSIRTNILIHLRHKFSFLNRIVFVCMIQLYGNILIVAV